MRKVKVTLYTREHGTQRYVRVKRNTEIRKDTIFVLRYAGEWETLKDCTSIASATARQIQKELELFRGLSQPKPQPTVKIKNDPQSLDVLIDKYLSERAAQRNWRKHTRQAYALGLKLFLQSLQSSGKTRRDEIEGDDLRNYAAFLRKYRTSTGKRYDDRSVYNHFLNVVTFLNAHGKRNLVEQRDWPRYEKKKAKPYDETDLARLLQFADEEEADVIEFFLGIGFRNGEGVYLSKLLLSASHEHSDRDGSFPRIPHQLVDVIFTHNGLVLVIDQHSGLKASSRRAMGWH